MRNVPIDGGRTYGPPANWDREAQGDCLSLSVLTIADDAGPIQFTAWRLGDAELAALMEGGHLFIGDVLPNVHVRRLLVQDEDGQVVGELLGSADGVRPVSLEQHRMDHARALTIAAALRSAIIAAGIELETRVRGGGIVDDWTGADNAGIVERLAAIVRLVRPVSDTVRIPLLKLDDVVRSGRSMPAGFSMSATYNLDPAEREKLRTNLERRLGVELNRTDIGTVAAAPPRDLFRRAASLVYRIEASGPIDDERTNIGRWKADARALAPELRASLSPEESAAPTAADVLRFLHVKGGQRIEAPKEVSYFVHLAADYIERKLPRSEWELHPRFVEFLEWLSE